MDADSDSSEAVQGKEPTKLPWKAMAVVFLPASYVLGFLVWATWAYGAGIGYIDHPPARYLLAGLPSAAILMVGWAVSLIIEDQAGLDRVETIKTRSGRVLREVLTYGSCFFLALLGILSSKESAWALVEIITASIATLVHLLIVRGTVELGTFLMSKTRMMPSVEAAEPGEGGVEIQVESVRRATKTGPGLLIAASVIVSSMAIYALTGVPVAFGGAEPRLAYLTLDSDQLSEDAVVFFFGDQGMHNGTRLDTQALWVYADTETTLYVHPEHPDERALPPIALSRNVVTAIRWLS